MLNTKCAPLAPQRWHPALKGCGWSPEPGRREHRPEVVHGHKPGDEYLRIAVRRHHPLVTRVRHALHLLAGWCPMR